MKGKLWWQVTEDRHSDFLKNDQDVVYKSNLMAYEKCLIVERRDLSFFLYHVEVKIGYWICCTRLKEFLIYYICSCCKSLDL